MIARTYEKTYCNEIWGRIEIYEILLEKPASSLNLSLNHNKKRWKKKNF
jgi:hypothetical protein